MKFFTNTGLLLLLCSSLLAIHGKTQQTDIARLPFTIQNVVKAAYPACAFIQKYDLKAKRRLGSRFSGVCVTSDGIILTAAHAAMPDSGYMVRFPDGREFAAVGKGRIRQTDAAVIQILEPVNLPFAEMGYSDKVAINDPCISIAYPGSFNPQVAVVRMGVVAQFSANRSGHFRSTCLMEPGDSGGPVFDLLGRVIGIHSAIDKGLDVNYEVPVDAFRDYWTSLLAPVNYRQLPAKDSVALFKEAMVSDSQFASGESLSFMNSLENTGNASCVEINSSSADTGVKVLGTLILPDPSTITTRHLKKKTALVISKSSLVADRPEVVLPSGKKAKAVVLARDVKKDLVLMSVLYSGEGAIDFNGIVQSSDMKNEDLGKILLSPRPGAKANLSVLGAAGVELKRSSAAGYMGLSMVDDSSAGMVSFVQPGSPAEKAGVTKGVVVRSVNDVLIHSQDELTEQMQLLLPGDSVHMVVARDELNDTLLIVLGKRPAFTSTHIAEQFEGGKSERRDGFGTVLVHDGKIIPSECGGPVFGADNKFIGVNIARYSRTSSLVIPAHDIAKFIKQYFEKISTAG